MFSEFIGYILERRLSKPHNKQISGAIMMGDQPAWRDDTGHHCFISSSPVLWAILSLRQKNFFMIPFIMLSWLQCKSAIQKDSHLQNIGIAFQPNIPLSICPQIPLHFGNTNLYHTMIEIYTRNDLSHSSIPQNDRSTQNRNHCTEGDCSFHRWERWGSKGLSEPAQGHTNPVVEAQTPVSLSKAFPVISQCIWKG